MKHLCDTVTYAEAVKLKYYGCKVETGKVYRIDACNSEKVELVNFVSKRDWNNWNGGCSRIFSAPTYAEVLDWMMDNTHNKFAYELREYLRNMKLYLSESIITKQKHL